MISQVRLPFLLSPSPRRHRCKTKLYHFSIANEETYAQDTCGISSGPSPAPGGAECGSGIDFVELKKLHQIASPVALLRQPTPPSCLFSPILLPRLLPTVDCCFVIIVFIVVAVIVIVVIVVIIIVVVVSFSRILLPNYCQQLIVALLSSS